LGAHFEGERYACRFNRIILECEKNCTERVPFHRRISCKRKRFDLGLCKKNQFQTYGKKLSEEWEEKTEGLEDRGFLMRGFRGSVAR